MQKFLATWLLTAVALIITAWLVPGITLTGFGAALLTAIILGFVNAVIRPLLILLTLPISILTLGLFLLVVNAVTFKLVSLLSIGFSVNGLFAAIVGPIVLSTVTWLIYHLLGIEKTGN
ncbi:MAG: phage holin family protein [Cyanobacteria bacterium WB6_1B_304]|jgi:putative membrane protein|nr:phage holin family protein [Cyanobacteria bacterium WB6_1B_304]